MPEGERGCTGILGLSFPVCLWLPAAVFYVLQKRSHTPARTCVRRVTGREKPDFWVTDPTRSIVVEVTSDIRTIASNIYATDHSLRFPRIKRVRWVLLEGRVRRVFQV